MPLQVNRVRDSIMHEQTQSDSVAVEMPVAVQFNGINHAVMLATPQDLEDFAWGFCLTEGIVRSPDDIRDFEQEQTDLGILAHVQISPACMQFLKDRRRQMAGRTACGLCGVETLEAVRRLPPVAPPSDAHRTVSSATSTQPQDLRQMSAGVTLAQLLSAMNALREQQPLHQETGATHAAAWIAPDSQAPAFIREDVGRHNALDKTIGALLRDSQPIGRGALLVSSRASFEMVQKAAMAGCPLLAAVSAPTSAAIALAKETGVTLLGFTRGDQATIYAHSQRFQLSDRGKAS
ncbi:formate dehydrogenase accessory sulfurtransferase FdhD [Advenella sp. S44]|uniref:formate dehydrogenase accessory sulfurtransferase FdhD n=1 Tax=Advenella sp. S44 TaxID=1982755 RepID=UPI001F5B4B08|nr:formate dehydrogenase accessory sulfurtransferase FdhD [Advenella sp. S44]